MEGFSSEFEDLRDYILKITYRIWEQKSIGKIRDWYHANAPIYTPLGFSNDVEDVIKGTLQTLHMFPDRELLAEDVVGAYYGDGVYYSSHKIHSKMTHLGDGFFKEPSKRVVNTKTIADCVCKADRVIEEWLVRDQSSIVKNIGLNVEYFGRALANSIDIKSAKEYEQSWSGGPKSGDIGGFSKYVVDFMRTLFENCDIDSIYDTHHRCCSIYMPGGSEFIRSIDFAEHVTPLLASFTKSKFKVHHHIELKEEDAPIRVSLRWTLNANHSGHGRYGLPTNEDICIMGISQFELLYGKIRHATHIFDELSIWAQIENSSKK